MPDPFQNVPSNQPFVVSPVSPAKAMPHKRPEDRDTGDPADRDPAESIAGMPPNAGADILPHVLTFSGIVRSAARTYMVSDEALQDAWDNASAMRNSLGIMECLEQRQRSTALLGWHLEPENRKSPEQKQLVTDLTAILNAIPNFLKLRECLLEALWYGKYAVQSRFRWDSIAGQRRLKIQRWRPVNGDKIVFRIDDGSGEYPEDQVGIRVGGTAVAGQLWANRWRVERVGKVMATDHGLAYFLENWERRLLAIHKHKIEDAEFQSPRNAGRIHGVGIRSRIYWEWYQSQEGLAWLMEFLERTALGYEVWGFPAGNPEAEQMVKKAAMERVGEGRNIIFVPLYPDATLSADRLMRRIEPGMGGAESLQKILTEFWGHRIKRYILGQTLTSEAASTGLGSGVASIHLDTYLQIIRYDARNLEESITEEIVKPLLEWNFPRWAGCPIKFKIETEAPDIEGKLAAWKNAFDMGLSIKAGDLYELIGAAQPGPEDQTLSLAQTQQGQQGQQGASGPEQGYSTDPANDVRQLMRQLGVAQYRRTRRRRLRRRQLTGQVERYREAHGDRQAEHGDHRDGWKTLGGARVAIKDGKIVAGCPGLKTERVDELGEDEAPENRQRREHRQDVAEHHGLEGDELTHAQVKQLEGQPHPDTGRDAEGKQAAQARPAKEEPTEAEPATVTIGANQFQVAKRKGLWFFRRNEAGGWTTASPEMALLIQKSLPSRPVSAQEVLVRIAASPNQPQDADWQAYAERWGVKGDFHTATIPVETLQKLSASGWLRMGRNTSAKTIKDKAESAKLNPVIITREPGKGLVVLDGTHSLIAAHERGDKDVAVIISDEAAPMVKDPGGMPDGRPWKHDAKRGQFVRKEQRESSRARIQRAIAETAKDQGVDPQSLSEALDFVYSERAQHAQAQEQAAAYARQSTGLSAGDIARLENQGHDYASAAKAGGATGQKFHGFEVKAEQVAHQYPELGWRDADDLAAKLWDLLRRGAQPLPAKDDPDLLREAAQLVLVSRAGAGGATELESGGWGDEEEVIPFARRGMVERYRRWKAERLSLVEQLGREFLTRGWPERQSLIPDP